MSKSLEVSLLCRVDVLEILKNTLYIGDAIHDMIEGNFLAKEGKNSRFELINMQNAVNG